MQLYNYNQVSGLQLWDAQFHGHADGQFLREHTSVSGVKTSALPYSLDNELSGGLAVWALGCVYNTLHY